MIPFLSFTSNDEGSKQLNLKILLDELTCLLSAVSFERLTLKNSENCIFLYRSIFAGILKLQSYTKRGTGWVMSMWTFAVFFLTEHLVDKIITRFFVSFIIPALLKISILKKLYFVANFQPITVTKNYLTCCAG